MHPAPSTSTQTARSGDREWYQETFLRIFQGWFRILEATSDSYAVWQPPNGIVLNNFVSKSGLQCDGVARMLPGLAAWAAQPANPRTLEVTEERWVDPKDIIVKALTNGTDPKHPDFWGNPGPVKNQRQVEASVIAWSLWLSRDWIFERLTHEHIANIQAWLAVMAGYTDHINNWSLFTAVNHALRHALRQHGFEGSVEEVRRDLLIGDELYLQDGWCWDKRYSNIDYYNFWVFGSHNCYLRAILPDWENPLLDRALEQLSLRLRDLPMLIDAAGQNVLFGRSLPYRWGWLNGLIAAHYVGIPAPDPGLSRSMLARNLVAWLNAGSIDEGGALIENLSPDGSRGGSSSYINCGHPYWGMQAFLCLALDPDHRFWTAPPRPFPVEEGDFQIARQGPGLVFQGFKESGEVRLFNLRNPRSAERALYDKFVYSSAFPCNSATTTYRTFWDCEFALRLDDGASVGPAGILEVDTHDAHTLRVRRRYRLSSPALDAVVHTTIRIEGESYTTEHDIEVSVSKLTGAQWVEGGFALGFHRDGQARSGRDGRVHWTEVRSVGRKISIENLEGWEVLHPASKWKRVREEYEPEPNILWSRSVHYLLAVPVKGGKTRLSARHSASVSRGSLGYRYGNIPYLT